MAESSAPNVDETSTDSEELGRQYREEEEKTKAYYERYYGEQLKPRDRKSIQMLDINGQPLVIDGIGKDWRLDVTAEMMAYGLSEENADKVAFDWYRQMSARSREDANEEAEKRFNDYVLSKE